MNRGCAEMKKRETIDLKHLIEELRKLAEKLK
jgi:hypothetical protein